MPESKGTDRTMTYSRLTLLTLTAVLLTTLTACGGNGHPGQDTSGNGNGEGEPRPTTGFLVQQRMKPCFPHPCRSTRVGRHTLGQIVRMGMWK